MGLGARDVLAGSISGVSGVSTISGWSGAWPSTVARRRARPEASSSIRDLRFSRRPSGSHAAQSSAIRRQALRRIQSAAMPVGVTRTSPPPFGSSNTLACPIQDPNVASPSSRFSATQACVQTEAAGGGWVSFAISIVVICPNPHT